MKKIFLPPPSQYNFPYQNLSEIYDLPNKEDSPLSADKLRIKARKEHYKFREKGMASDLDNIKLTDKNRLSYKTLQHVYEKVGSLISEPQEIMNRIYGSSILFSNVVKSEPLSQELTGMFESTKVNVYVFNANWVNAFTVPNAPITGSPFMLKLQEFFSFGFIKYFPIIFNIFSKLFSGFMFGSALLMTILATIEQIGQMGLNTFKNGNPWKMVYRPSTGKVFIGTDNISLYITSSMIKLLDDDRQLKAVALHEIGHNLNYFYSIMRKLINITILGFFFKTIISPGTSTSTSTKYTLTISPTYVVVLTIFIVLFIYMIAFLFTFPSKLDETYADEFAIKMGYGKELEEALIKMTRFYSYWDNLGKKGSLIERILLKYSKLMNLLVGLYPINRLKKIHEKTAQYDTSDRNIDRTARIKYTKSDRKY